jgi:diacylglycerol kinase family enzyme
MKTPPKQLEDTGEFYAAGEEDATRKLRTYINEACVPTQVRKLNTDKPVAVIFNPTSGSKTDIRPTIESKLSKHGIKVKFYETERYMHAWELAEKDIDFTAHSAILACGGDGTMHEVINGMLMRADGLKLPVLIVPNGSGNDFSNCFRLKSVSKALEWLIKGDLISIDVNKVLFDCAHEDEIPAEQRR